MQHSNIRASLRQSKCVCICACVCACVLLSACACVHSPSYRSRSIPSSSANFQTTRAYLALPCKYVGVAGNCGVGACDIPTITRSPTQVNSLRSTIYSVLADRGFWRCKERIPPQKKNFAQGVSKKSLHDIAALAPVGRLPNSPRQPERARETGDELLEREL